MSLPGHARGPLKFHIDSYSEKKVGYNYLLCALATGANDINNHLKACFLAGWLLRVTALVITIQRYQHPCP